VRRPIVAGPGPLRLVSATIDATGNGNRPIAAAVYTLDVPPWEDDATPVPLAAADDAFDSPVESVVAELDSSALAPGRHILYLRGQDTAGHWGPVSAAFFTVPTPPATEWLFLPSILRQ
jgi:carboxypeptidase T